MSAPHARPGLDLHLQMKIKMSAAFQCRAKTLLCPHSIFLWAVFLLKLSSNPKPASQRILLLPLSLSARQQRHPACFSLSNWSFLRVPARKDDSEICLYLRWSCKDEVLWQTHKKLVFASLSLSHSDLGTSGLTDLCVKPEKKKSRLYSVKRRKSNK